LQSGDDHILKKMHRPYTASYFRNLVEDIHGLIPDAAIGVDTLIGFPGETQEAFENTYKLIEELPVTYLHVFPFSPRKQTPADKYPGKVKPDTLKSRCGNIRNLARKKKREFYKKAVSKNVKVLIEGKRDRATGLLKGLTANYIPVLVNGDDSLKNSFVNVKVVKLNRSDSVQGVRCDGDP
jgi:threonylcarbamoyladenosine tRNA methylthiotransferase MtaB